MCSTSGKSLHNHFKTIKSTKCGKVNVSARTTGARQKAPSICHSLAVLYLCSSPINYTPVPQELPLGSRMMLTHIGEVPSIHNSIYDYLKLYLKKLNY